MRSQVSRLRATPLFYLLLLGLFVAGPDLRAASTESPPLQFGERVEVNVVNVEVFVTDAQGRRVENLGAQDFRLLEDGKPVDISNFYAVSRGDRILQELAANRDDGRAGETPSSSSAPPENLPPPRDQQLNLLVYVDNANITPVDRTRVMKDLGYFLEDRMAQGDQVMIVGHNQNIQVFQGFTRDRERVARALKEVQKQGAHRVQDESEFRRAILEIQQSIESGRVETAYNALRAYVVETHQETRQSLDALEGVVRSMGGLPGRKAVLYVSDGIPQRPGAALYEQFVSFFGSTSLRMNGRVGGQLGSGPAYVVDPSIEAVEEEETHLMAEVTRAANAHQVTFYTLDAEGVDSQMALSAADLDNGLGSAGENRLISLRQQNLQEPLIQMADATGGTAVLNTSAFEDALDGVGNDFDSFYSLGFRATHGGDGRYHTISVEVSNPAWKVRHRTGYVDKPEAEMVADRTLSSLFLDIEKNPLGIAVAFGEPQKKSRGKYLMPILVRIPMRQVTLLPNGGRHQGQLRIYLAVEDDAGGSSDVFQTDYPVQIADDQLAAALDRDIGYVAKLELRKGTPRVAIGVWDEVGGQESFVLKEALVGPR